MERSPRLLGGIAASTLFVAAILALLVASGGYGRVMDVLLWLDGLGHWAMLWFILIMALVVFFLLPGIPFTTGAGFVFGLLEGTIAVVVGTTIGAVLAFLAGRFLLGERAAEYLETRPRLRGVGEELAAGGWKAAMFVRFVPFFPSKLANYLFGLTRMRLLAFAAGTFLGVIPLSLHSVYLGAIAADLTAIGGFGTERTPILWAFYILGFVVTLAAVVFLGRLAQRALTRIEREGA